MSVIENQERQQLDYNEIRMQNFGNNFKIQPHSNKALGNMKMLAISGEPNHSYDKSQVLSHHQN